jgi:hypothetical protein
MGPVRNQDLCQYLGQLCLNERARSRRGSLLLLCEEHRTLANRNQRRYRLRQELLRLKQEMDAQAPRLPSVPRAPRQPPVLRSTASIVKDTVDQAMELWFIETFGQGVVEGLGTPGSWLPLHEFDCSSEDTIQELLDTYFTDEDDQQ